MNLGNVASGRNDFAGSLPLFNSGLKLAEPLLEKHGRFETRAIVRNCHWGLADSLVHLHRDSESIPHWEAMLRWIRSPKDRTSRSVFPEIVR